jgi:UDP-3-O-[3-hydroxymyristoyl] glucosamine N-acyltransferase
MEDVAPGDTVSGTPSLPHQRWLKSIAAFAQLPELRKEVRELRKQLDALRAEEEEK